MYKRRREEVSFLVKKIYDESNQIYGANKIHAILKERAIEASPEYIRGIMNELGLKSIRTNAKKDYLKLNAKKKLDLLKLEFTANSPNEIWVSDTTGFKLQGKWYYICAILDLYSRKVIAYKMSPKHSANLISGTFKTSYSCRSPKDLTFHSDRGTQYTAQAFMLLLKNLSVTQSFSPSGKPCHNAVMESFFSTLKKEEIYRTNYTSFNHFKGNIEKYILFYNDNRPHSTLNHNTPNAFEKAFLSRKQKQI